MIIKTENRSYYIVLHCVMDQPETRDELESVLESGMYLEPNAEIKVKLDRDIVCDDPMKYCNNIEIFAGHVTLDLAGHTIDFNAQQPKDYNYIFFINPQYEYGDSSTLGIYTTFTIEDSVGGGKITGGWNGTLGGAVSVGTPGTFNMIGGSITGNKAREGGAILNWGTVNLSNCTISDNTADRYGGAIYGGGTLNVGGGITLFASGDYTWHGWTGTSVVTLSGKNIITGNTMGGDPSDLAVWYDRYYYWNDHIESIADWYVTTDGKLTEESEIGVMTLATGSGQSAFTPGVFIDVR